MSISWTATSEDFGDTARDHASRSFEGETTPTPTAVPSTTATEAPKDKKAETLAALKKAIEEAANPGVINLTNAVNKLAEGTSAAFDKMIDDKGLVLDPDANRNTNLKNQLKAAFKNYRDALESPGDANVNRQALAALVDTSKTVLSARFPATPTPTGTPAGTPVPTRAGTAVPTPTGTVDANKALNDLKADFDKKIADAKKALDEANKKASDLKKADDLADDLAKQLGDLGQNKDQGKGNESSPSSGGDSGGDSGGKGSGSGDASGGDSKKASNDKDKKNDSGNTPAVARPTEAAVASSTKAAETKSSDATIAKKKPTPTPEPTPDTVSNPGEFTGGQADTTAQNKVPNIQEKRAPFRGTSLPLAPQNNGGNFGLQNAVDTGGSTSIGKTTPVQPSGQTFGFDSATFGPGLGSVQYTGGSSGVNYNYIKGGEKDYGPANNAGEAYVVQNQTDDDEYGPMKKGGGPIYSTGTNLGPVTSNAPKTVTPVGVNLASGRGMTDVLQKGLVKSVCAANLADICGYRPKGATLAAANAAKNAFLSSRVPAASSSSGTTFSTSSSVVRGALGTPASQPRNDNQVVRERPKPIELRANPGQLGRPG